MTEIVIRKEGLAKQWKECRLIRQARDVHASVWNVNVFLNKTGNKQNSTDDRRN